MLVAVSPYHLTTREPPAMAALLLAERVVTMIPSPSAGAGHAALHRAVERSPQYLRFMQSWEWSLPLWRAGVISSVLDGHDPCEEVFEACARIDSDPALAGLRPLMRPELFESDERYLAELSRDVLRAGPDPCFSVPVAAGLDRFAARFGAMVARSEPVSIAQRAEATLARPLFAVAVPVLLQAGGDLILRARAALDTPLEALRRAIAMSAGVPSSEHWSEVAVASAPGRTAGSSGSASVALASPLRAAAAQYTEAFERALPGLAAPRDEARAVGGLVALEAAVLPETAVLRASLAAVRAMRSHGRAEEPAIGPDLDDPSARPVVTLFIRSIGATARSLR